MDARIDLKGLGLVLSTQDFLSSPTDTVTCGVVSSAPVAAEAGSFHIQPQGALAGRVDGGLTGPEVLIFPQGVGPGTSYRVLLFSAASDSRVGEHEGKLELRTEEANQTLWFCTSVLGARVIRTERVSDLHRPRSARAHSVSVRPVEPNRSATEDASWSRVILNARTEEEVDAAFEHLFDEVQRCAPDDFARCDQLLAWLGSSSVLASIELELAVSGLRLTHRFRHKLTNWQDTLAAVERRLVSRADADDSDSLLCGLQD